MNMETPKNQSTKKTPRIENRKDDKLIDEEFRKFFTDPDSKEEMMLRIEKAILILESSNPMLEEKTNKANKKRADVIRKRFLEGKSRKEVAEIYDVIPERIRQIEVVGLGNIRKILNIT